ncbi:MAG: hypothetical protein CSA10_01270, partial [Cardiobacteriales bacterium]
MTKKILLISYLFGMLGGCVFSSEQQLYEVRMMSGERLYAKSKPKIDNDGYYRFKDVNNQSYIVRKNLI